MSNTCSSVCNDFIDTRHIVLHSMHTARPMSQLDIGKLPPATVICMIQRSRTRLHACEQMSAASPPKYPQTCQPGTFLPFHSHKAHPCPLTFSVRARANPEVVHAAALLAHEPKLRRMRQRMSAQLPTLDDSFHDARHPVARCCPAKCTQPQLVVVAAQASGTVSAAVQQRALAAVAARVVEVHLLRIGQDAQRLLRANLLIVHLQPQRLTCA